MAAVGLDQVLKVVQIAFYIVAGAVAVLTYRSARYGLLNSVNVEYKKRVMDRLLKVADDLFAEFDSASSQFWAASIAPSKSPLAKQVRTINEAFQKRGPAIFENGRYIGAIIAVERWAHLERFAASVETDPVMPEAIRRSVLTLMNERIRGDQSVFIEVMSSYARRLADGTIEPKDANWVLLHNEIGERLATIGIDISQIHERVNEIRLEIQEYLESFDPLLKRARRKRTSRVGRRPA